MDPSASSWKTDTSSSSSSPPAAADRARAGSSSKAEGPLRAAAAAASASSTEDFIHDAKKVVAAELCKCVILLPALVSEAQQLRQQWEQTHTRLVEWVDRMVSLPGVVVHLAPVVRSSVGGSDSSSDAYLCVSQAVTGTCQLLLSPTPASTCRARQQPVRLPFVHQLAPCVLQHLHHSAPACLPACVYRAPQAPSQKQQQSPGSTCSSWLQQQPPSTRHHALTAARSSTPGQTC